MIVIKPFKPKKKPCTLDIDDDFYKYAHAINVDEIDYSLCGVGSEEWNYSDYKEVKKITCPRCLGIIKECKSYKL